MGLSATEIDALVGKRMRERREALGISQGRLGRHLGLNFSQIQKYEKGANRIGAGRLLQITAYLGVAPGYFFEGISDRRVVPDGTTVPPQPESEQELALLEAFRRIEDPESRASVLALVCALSSPKTA